MNKKKRNQQSLCVQAQVIPRPKLCPVCGRTKNLHPHHTKKEIVFGKNPSIVLICDDCRHKIQCSVRLMEGYILRNFAPVYQKIWEYYTQNRHLTGTEITGYIEQCFIEIDSIVCEYISIVDNPKNNDRGVEGICLRCGHFKELARHHPFKRAVFGENDVVYYICKECHTILERSVTHFEATVLRKFSRCYAQAWREFASEGFIDKDRIEWLVQREFLSIKAKRRYYNCKIKK